MAIPNPGDIADPATTKGQMKTYLEGVRTGTATAVTSQGAEALTIATGAIAPEQSIFTVETEGGASADDLTNIDPANFNEGDLVFMRAVNGAHEVTVKHNANGSAGVIKTQDGADLVLDSADTLVLLQCIKSTSPDEWRVRAVLGAVAPTGGIAVFAADDTFTVPAGVTNLKRAAMSSGGGGGGGGASATNDGADGSNGGSTRLDRGMTTLVQASGAFSAGLGGKTAGRGGAFGGVPNAAGVGDILGAFPGANGQHGISGVTLAPTQGGRCQLGKGGGSGGVGHNGGGSGGGGGVAWTESFNVAVTPLEDLDIVIGIGGAGGTAGAGGSATDGTDGQDGIVILEW